MGWIILIILFVVSCALTAGGLYDGMDRDDKPPRRLD